MTIGMLIWTTSLRRTAHHTQTERKQVNLLLFGKKEGIGVLAVIFYGLGSGGSTTTESMYMSLL